MIRLLILADDFTGALDSGVQLAKTGAVTHVVTDCDICFNAPGSEIKVLVIDTETRHLPADQARRIIKDISSRATAAGIPVIYKKTDSALRGNIGAELEGVLEGSGARRLYFIPAFPKLGRSTRDGIHYLDGIPIHKTVFGKDPFEPVQDSYVPDIIRKQSKVPVVLVRQSEEIPDSSDEKAIMLFDASSNEALDAIAKHFRRMRPTNVLAGCAGFAAYLPYILDLKRPTRPVRIATSGILVVSGSLNPITARQLETARKAGFDCVELTQEQKLFGIPENKEGDAFLDEIMERYNKLHCLLIVSACVDSDKDTLNGSFDEESHTVAANIGKLVLRLFDRGMRGTVAATGGDTLRGVLNNLGCKEIMPLCEVETGVVLSQASIAGGSLMIVSKSGGIGTDEVFIRVAEYLNIELPHMSLASEN